MEVSLEDFLDRAQSQANRQHGVGCAVVARHPMAHHLPGAASMVCDERFRIHTSLLGPRDHSIWLASPEPGLARAVGRALLREERDASWVASPLSEDRLVNTTSRVVLWSPDPYLRQRASTWATANVLDLGCGSGRDSVYLAQLGHRVRGVDRLPDALLLARQRAELSGVEVEWQAADLRDPDSVDWNGVEVLIAIRLQQPSLVAELARHLPAGGRLLLRGLADGGPKSSDRRFQVDPFVEALGPGWRWLDGPRALDDRSLVWIELEARRL